jgi:MFS family permease
MPTAPRHVLPVIVVAQFASTSLWFAVNAVMPDLQHALGLAPSAIGSLTSAVQLGFIAGTLVFALGSVADRHSPRLVFLLCAIAGALFNAAPVAWPAGALDLPTLWVLRALTGFALAGIYPVGMKIAAGWYPQGLGRALGWLIGALVLGTAMPHALRAMGTHWPWQQVMLVVSMLALLGGWMVWQWVPESAHLPRATRLQWRAFGSVLTNRRLRAPVLGYFGHMWELYTLWVLLPALLATRLQGAAISVGAFSVIGAGAIGCIAGGWLAQRHGSARVAAVQLALSGLCCVLTPLAMAAPDGVFAAWLLVWGVSVAGDSPQFSALTATHAPREAVGSVLTLVNCIGFSISILSIQAFVALAQRHDLALLLPWLGLGPLLGLWALRPLLIRDRSSH